MTNSYFTILLNQLEQMHFEVAAAAEAVVPPEPGQSVPGFDGGDCALFLQVTGGKGRLQTECGDKALGPGDCAIVLPGTAHELLAEPEGTLAFKWCRIRIKYGDRETYRLLNLPLVVSFPSTEAERLIDKVIRCLPQEKAACRLRVKAAALELICLYLENLPVREGDCVPTQEITKIDTVLSYIDSHLHDNLTIETLARLVYLHPNYFIVFFKSMMGCSPIQYVNQRRMEKAKQLLLDQSCSVSETAKQIGMKIYYFSRMFKAYTGLTPSRYRKLADKYAGDAEALLAAGNEAEDEAGAEEEEL